MVLGFGRSRGGGFAGTGIWETLVCPGQSRRGAESRHSYPGPRTPRPVLFPAGSRRCWESLRVPAGSWMTQAGALLCLQGLPPREGSHLKPEWGCSNSWEKGLCRPVLSPPACGYAPTVVGVRLPGSTCPLDALTAVGAWARRLRLAASTEEACHRAPHPRPGKRPACWCPHKVLPPSCFCRGAGGSEDRQGQQWAEGAGGGRGRRGRRAPGGAHQLWGGLSKAWKCPSCAGGRAMPGGWRLRVCSGMAVLS